MFLKPLSGKSRMKGIINMLQKIFKFEALDLTQIFIHLLTLVFLLIILFFMYFAFKEQLTDFFKTLENRAVQFSVSPTGTTIRLDAPVEPHPVTDPIDVRPAMTSNPEDWDASVPAGHNIDQFTKGGFSSLHDELESLDPQKKGVLGFVVNSDLGYYPDREMLVYFTSAAEKIRYLVFYNQQREFQGLLRIDDAITGLAVQRQQFRDFGRKLTQGDWRAFPHLIVREDAFEQPPTIRQLYKKLETGFLEVPLLENGRLKGILDYVTVSDALYKQVEK